jgi:hypothetical protein
MLSDGCRDSGAERLADEDDTGGRNSEVRNDVVYKRESVSNDAGFGWEASGEAETPVVEGEDVGGVGGRGG